MPPLGLSLNLGSLSVESSSSVQRSLPQSYLNEYALYVDGTESVEVMSVANQNALFVDDFSYQIWYYDTNPSTSFLMGAYQPVGVLDYFIALRILNFGTIYASPTLIIQNGTSGLANITSDYIQDDFNHFVVTVKKGATASDSATMKFYLNGSLKGTFTAGLPDKEDHEGFSASSLTPFAIGGLGKSSGVDQNASGFIDEVAFWSAELDADAVSELYNNGESFALNSDNGDYDYSSDLKHWFRFENDYSDETGNAPDGSANGTPSFPTAFGYGGSVTPP